mgnify:FL=1
MKNDFINLPFRKGKRISLLVMRFAILLFCTTALSLSPKLSFSQKNIIVEKEQTLNVDELFSIIQQQTDYHFIFPKRIFKNSPQISLKPGEISVLSLLNKSLENSNLKFRVDQNNIITILKDPEAKNKQEQVTVSGVVIDSNGAPLPGVSVMIVDESKGVVTDFDGAYSITAPNNATLQFSYVGFVTRTLNIADLSYFNDVNVTLQEDVNALDEVVVTGYQELSKERTAGSFSKVTSEQLEQRPSSPNIIDRITGQIAGLNVNPIFNTFEIRGRSTIFGGQAGALIVVDGFPLADQQNIESINPEDVESITILKDAAASSIWGARASNGVVVIVTKTGRKNQQLTVNASSFFEVEDKVDLDDFNWMSTGEEIDLDMEFIDKGWTNIASLPAQTGSINDLHLAYLYRSGLSPDGNVWSQNTFDKYVDMLRQRNINDQWEKYLLRAATRTTHNLSISGGGKRNSYFASLSYTNKKDQSIGDEDDRITMNLRNVFDFNDKISFTAGMTAVLRNQQRNSLESQFGTFGGSIGLAELVQPYDQLIDENGQYIQKYASWNPWISQDREDITGAPYTFNFVEEQRNRDVSSTLMDIRADFQLNVEVLKDLDLSSSFRYERNTDDLDAFKSMNLPSWRNTVNDYYVFDSDLNRYVNRIPEGAEYLQERSYSKGWVFKNTLNWDKTLGDHDLTLFAGAEVSRRFSESLLNRKFGYDKQTTNFLPINEVDLTSYRITNWNGQAFTRYYDRLIFNIDNQDNRFVSGFSNLAYTYDDKYTLNGSFRIDQANIYGSNPDFRYKPLWSVGGAWNIHNEAFAEYYQWLDRLKLRATYGLGGNTINNASPFPTARNRNINWGNPYITLVLSQPGNPDLKWEETATTNLGLDFAFLNNRISGSFDYYFKKSTDVYTALRLDPTVGFASSNVNYADIDNKGVEFVLNADLIRTSDFNWSVRANFNVNKNELVTYNATSSPSVDGFTSGGSAYEEGRPIRGIYGYNFAGLDENGEVLLYDGEGNTKSWRESVEFDELVYKGSGIPTNYGGLSTRLAYKGFDLTVNMNYQSGFYFKKSFNYASVGYGAGNNVDYDFSNIRLHEIWADRWMQPGDEAFTNVPKVFYNGLNPNTGEIENRFDTAAMHRIWNQSTNAIHKGDYIRVQDIILGYSLPANTLQSTFFKSLRFTAQVSNPFLFVANDLGLDPVAPDTEAFTNLTRYTFGIRANF